MRSLKLNFEAAGASFNFDRPAVDSECVIQNALVNVGTIEGSDPLFPDRGTGLMEDGARGRMVSPAWANHSANFAALQTLAFIQKTTPNVDDSMQTFKLQVSKFDLQSLDLEVLAVLPDGTQVGEVVTL